MGKHFITEIEQLKKSVFALSSLVEESLYLAVKSVLKQDLALAESVMQRDDIIDQREVQVEEECLKILALYGPVANDLRFVVAVLKLNNDLERIGDLAVNISQRARTMIELPKIPIPFDFSGMADKVKLMLRKSLEALVNGNTALAREVVESDQEIDDINRRMHKDIQAAIHKDPSHLESLICLISVSRNLERIGDHATNIAEDVIYCVEGDIIRHGR